MKIYFGQIVDGGEDIFSAINETICQTHRPVIASAEVELLVNICNCIDVTVISLRSGFEIFCIFN